jgi:trimeric autotransporter adhesin
VAVLLVGIVILGLVTTVIIIGARVHDDRPPTTAECETDRSTVLRAEEAFHARQGRYATETELVDVGLLQHNSSLHDLTLNAGSYNIVPTGGCAEVVSSTAAAPNVRLVMSAIPDTVVAGRVIDPPITVTLTDDSGAVVTDNAAEVTITLQAGNGARLFGTGTVRAVAGIATFTNLSIDKVGSGYSFAAEAQGATSASGGQVTVLPGMPATLRFVAAPTAATPGVEFATQPIVEVDDVAGNVITDATDPITLALSAADRAEGRLACLNMSVVPIAGVATFAGCQIDQPGTAYRLTATASALDGASGRFAVIGPATQLEVVQQPAQAVAGDTLSGIVVAVEDSAGNVITDSDATISVTVNQNAESLTGTTSLAVVDGVAAFSDLAIGTSAGGYRLTMKASGLKSTTTAPFDVTTGAGTQLVFTRQPSGAKAGKSWSTQPIVSVEDAYGNVLITAIGTITVQLTPGTGTEGATLACAFNPLAVTNGEARFSKCFVDRSGTKYTLTATADGLTDAVSAPFSIG